MSNLTIHSMGSSSHSVGVTGSNPVASVPTLTPQTSSSSNSGRTSIRNRQVSGAGNIMDMIAKHPAFSPETKRQMIDQYQNTMMGIIKNI